MEIIPLFGNKYVIGIAGSIGGAILTLLTQQFLQRRGLFTYFVNHFRVGVSEDDAIFGSVRITWNNNPVKNLYLSTIELANVSSKDYENIVVRAFTNDTILLTERSEIVGTVRNVNWTDDFKIKLEVIPGQQVTEAQFELHSRQREYLIPVMNRGQIVRFQFLNTAKSESQPSIWLDVLHKGVKLKFQAPQNQVFGVAQPHAAVIGIIFGIILVLGIIAFVDSVPTAAIIALVYGLFAQLPGALIIKSWRLLKEFFGG